MSKVHTNAVVLESMEADPTDTFQAFIELTQEEVDWFIGQGDDSGFGGNDLLYPIYEALKAGR